MSVARKRILVAIDWYLPGFRGGGPITSIANLVDALGDQYDFSIVTSDTDDGESAPYENTATDQWVELGPNCRVWYCSREGRSYTHFRKLLGETDYDLLYLNSMFSLRYTIFPLWSSRAAKPEVPVLLAPRGMLHAGALRLKPLKKKVFLKVLRWMGITKHLIFQATDDQEFADIKGIFGEATQVLQAPNLPRMHQPAFASIEKCPNKLRLIFLSRLTEKKGLHLLLEMLRAQSAEIHLDIVGPDTEAGYWQRCAALVALLPKNITVHKSDGLPQQAAFALLQAAHCFAMPTMGENFGHSIFEAFVAGRPVLISDQSPWRNLETQQLGFDIPLESKPRFSEAISKLAAMDQLQWEQFATSSWSFAAAYLKRPEMLQATIAMLESAMSPKLEDKASN
jgi:glycosyltransferase involved in cell wall biosynthesis